MMSNNKILTVSYGTFSCTLEGFDDSFGTMKAIAEYFRDLAADDRYFGAEPPQPDAEMLARIAEREISRRVEAREQEGRIVLSANPSAAAPALGAVADDAPVAAAESVEVEEAQPTVVETPVEAADVVHELQEADPAPDSTDDSAIDAVLAVTQDDATEEETAIVETDEAPDDVASDENSIVVDTPAFDENVLAAVAEDDAAEDITQAAASEDANVEDAEETVSGEAPDETIEAFFADAPEGDAVFEDEPEADDAEAALSAAAATAPDSIAAKLQRIRAVVSQSQDEAESTPLFEDEHAEGFATDAEMEDVAEDAPEVTGEALLAEVVADFDASASVPEDTEATDESVDVAQEEIDVEALLDVDPSETVDAEPTDMIVDADVTEEAHTQAEERDEDISDILARLDDAADEGADEAIDDQEPEAVAAPEDHVETDTPSEEVMVDDVAEDTSIADALSSLENDEDEPGAEENLFDEAAETAGADPVAELPTEAPRRARIIKVKRSQIEAALAQGQIEEVETDDDTQASSLSDDEEAELQAELDAVAAELPDAPESDVDGVAEAHMDDDAIASSDPVADADVSRLMAEADNQMEEPESSRRRNAFQHLKAAVMAKKSDKGLGQETQKDEGAFRSDLASVVVPRRPATGGTPRDERPAPDRPAPLKLVAEQRVDLGNGSDAPSAPKPVRPRRIVHAETTGSDEGASSFADYADELGAHSLSDLLEAAASYLSFVEGHDEFSRPQLMHKVRQLQKDDFSREDGLRTFGQLLRAGKIEKQKGGRFTVTDDIGYRPDERAAG